MRPSGFGFCFIYINLLPPIPMFGRIWSCPSNHTPKGWLLWWTTPEIDSNQYNFFLFNAIVQNALTDILFRFSVTCSSSDFAGRPRLTYLSSLKVKSLTFLWTSIWTKWAMDFCYWSLMKALTSLVPQIWCSWLLSIIIR